MIDWYIIEEFEGGLKTDGYVPKKHGKVIGNSGVTIGGGVDLGSRSASSLRDLHVSPEIVEILMPYLGLKGIAADRQVSAYPVRLSRGQARALTEAVKAGIVREVSGAYEKGSGRAWEQLPDRAQTVIASLAFNFGSQLWVEMKTTWGMIVANDWARLSRWLRQFPGKQPELDKRRKQEGIHLMPLYLQDHK